MSALTRVPVVLGFDNNRVVGELSIQSDALPPNPDFCFALGFLTDANDETKPGEIPRKPYLGSYKLLCISMVPDANYANYLQQIGVGGGL